MISHNYHLHRVRLRLYLKVIVILLILLDVSYLLIYNDQGKTFLSDKISQLSSQGVDVKKDSTSVPILHREEEYANVIKNDIVLSEKFNGANRIRTLFPSKHYHRSSRYVKSTVAAHKNFGEFDRRLLPALWLNLINQNISSATTTSGQLSDNFKLPFNWDLLNNVAARLPMEPYFNRVIKEKINCVKFRDIAPNNQPGTFLQNFCEDYNYKKPNFENDYRLPIKVVRKVDQYLTDVDWRRIQGMMYVLIQAEIPSNVLFLGGVADQKKSLIVPLEKVSNGVNDMTKVTKKKDVTLNSYYDTMVENYIEQELAKAGNEVTRDELLLQGISVYKELVKLNDALVTSSSERVPLYKPSSPTLVGAGISHDPPSEVMALDKSQFKWNLPDEIKTLKKQIKQARTGQNTSQLNHLLQWSEFIVNPKNKQPWYYGIPSIQGKLLDHYDWRFFHDVTYEDDQEAHVNVLHRLARTWFKLCQEFDVPSWLNHGSLIGWYWNGASMPYDGDLDLQLPIQSLHKLSRFLNNTLIYDFSDNLQYVNEDWHIDNRAELGIRSYLFDVDPMYLDRNGINSGENNIDARIIDTETGLYIDLTALADFHSETQYNLKTQKKYLEISGWTHPRIVVPTHIDQFFNKDGNNYKSKDHTDKTNKILQDLIKQIDEALKKGVTNSLSSGSPTKDLFKDFVHCKHFHTYNLNELFPLIPTYFENTVSYLPANWYRNLVIDYGSTKAIENSYYHNNKFWDSVKLWLSHNDCPEWDHNSGSIPKGKDEMDIVLRCMSRSELFDKQVRTSHYYGLQHETYRSALKVQKDGVVEYDYEQQLLPVLEKSRVDHPLKSEPFVDRYLYN